MQVVEPRRKQAQNSDFTQWFADGPRLPEQHLRGYIANDQDDPVPKDDDDDNRQIEDFQKSAKGQRHE